MYDILGKFNNLTPQEKTTVVTAPAPLYESVEARGSIVAGVKDVEQKLREQFASMKEDMSRAAKGHEKYGKAGMEALAKAGKAGASEKELDAIRDKYDRYDKEDMAEAMPATDAKVDKLITSEAARKILDALGAFCGPENFEYKWNQDDTVTISKRKDKQWADDVYRKMGRSLNDPDLLRPGACTSANMHKAIDQYFDMFRSKGWIFTQPVAGQFTIGATKSQEPVEEERETLKTKSGTIYKGGTYGTEYQGDADDETAPKRGRPAAGTARKEKVERVKGPKGRPKKDPAPTYSKSNDPFGRVPDKAPKGAKGTVIKGKATQDTNEATKNPYAIGMAQAKKEVGLGKAKTHVSKSVEKRAHHIGKTIKANESLNTRLAKLLIEGVNFTEMIKKKDITLQEMLAELQNDIHTFKETGHCSELLRDCMEVHSFNKQQLNDATEKPMDNDNFPTPLAPAQPSMMDRVKRMGGHVLNKLGHGSDEDMKADLRRKMGMQEAAELNELARLAGLTVKEGNDGNLANNAKPYDAVTQGDVIAGRLGKDAMGGKHEVDESDDDNDGNMYMADVLRGIAQKFAQKAHQGDDGQFWADQAGIVMKASRTIDQQGMEAGMQVLNTCDCWDALGDELELHDIDVQDLVDQYDLNQHAAGDYRNFGSDYDGANEDPHGYDDEMDEGVGQFYVYHKTKGDRAGGADYDLLKTFPDKDSATSFAQKYNNKISADKKNFHSAVVRTKSVNDDMEEGAGVMHFKAQQAKADGKDSFKLGDEEFPVQEGETCHTCHQNPCDCNEMEEGAGVMHFKAEKAKEAGKDHFNMGGEEFPVQEGETCPTCHSEPCCCEDMEEADRELAKLKENCGIVSPIGSMAQDMQQQQGKMSINTSQSTDGTKNINISADGEAADQLMQILKMAGMASGQQAEVVVTAQPMEAKEYGNTDVEEPEEVLNTPRPRVKGMHSAETVGFANTSDDLHKQKGQHPKTAAKGDNPLATHRHHEETLESANPLESLGARLMAEYQGIKISK